MPYGPLLNENQGNPQSVAPVGLDELLGVLPPQLDTTTEAVPQRSRRRQILEDFLINLGASKAGEGGPPSFVGGLAQGLGAAGNRIAAQRAKLESAISERAKARNAANLEATRDYQKQRFEAGQNALKRAGQDTGTPVTDADIAQFPQLARIRGALLTREERARLGMAPTNEQIAATEKAKTAAGGSRDEPLIAIQTPNGPKLVRRADAVGKEPARTTDRPTLKPPSAGERDALIGDSSYLADIKAVRESFNPQFVGPVAGRAGGTRVAVGMSRKGETEFRSRVAGLRNQILKMRSGGAVTEGEAARLLEELPTENLPSAEFLSRLDTFERRFRVIAESRRDVLSSTGVDLSRLKPLPESEATAIDPALFWK